MSSPLSQLILDIDHLFENQRAAPKKLTSFGFTKKKKDYAYSTDLFDGQFSMQVTVTADGKITADVFDTDTGEIYAPLKAVSASGAFVGKIRAEYEKLLKTIAAQCFELEIFKTDYAKKIIAYAKRKYGNDPEYLWKKFPRNAILRRSDNAKWYAALLTIPKYKIGLTTPDAADANDIIEILDLRIPSAEMSTTVDSKKYFPGYHMNKKHWVTLCLDGSVPIKEIYSRTDDSYLLAKK